MATKIKSKIIRKWDKVLKNYNKSFFCKKPIFSRFFFRKEENAILLVFFFIFKKIIIDQSSPVHPVSESREGKGILSHLCHMWNRILYRLYYGYAWPVDFKTVPCLTLPVDFEPSKIQRVPVDYSPAYVDEGDRNISSLEEQEHIQSRGTGTHPV